MRQYPSLNEVSSSKLKKLIEQGTSSGFNFGRSRLHVGVSGEPLVNIKFMPPQTVVAEEADACDRVMLIAGGKLEFFRRIKTCKDQASIEPSSFKGALEPRQMIKELKNAYGDSVLIKDISS